MKYYKINWDYDNLKIIGHYPQLTLKKGYNPGPPNGHWEVHPHEFPDFVPNLELTLHKKAKATDFLENYVSFGMLINNKFKEILKGFKLPPQAFYPIKVYHKGELIEYYWFHYIVKDFWEWIDKDKSKAVITDNKKNFIVVKEVNLKLSVKKIRELEDNLPYYQNMKWEKIVFKKGFPKYDVYKTQHIDYIIVISERLLNVLQEAGMTGFEVELFDDIFCE